LHADDMDDFTIRPAVDLDVVQILETMQSSKPLPILQISLADGVESVLPPLIHLTQLYQTNSLTTATISTLPRIKFVVFPVLVMMLLKHLIRTQRRYIFMFRLCHGSLRTNSCFDLIASEISSLKSVSLDLLSLLRHFSVGYFTPAAQNLCWHWANNCHSGWDDHSWILYSKPEYYLLNSSWFIAFIVNAIFVNHHNLMWSMR
jgi:hypothetical protein